MSDETLRKRLIKAGVRFERNVMLSAHDVFHSFHDDKKQVEIDIRAEELHAMRRDNRKADGELLDFIECEKKLWSDLLGPLRLELEQLPKVYSPLCNPQEPAVAESVLTQFVEKLKLKLKGHNDHS